MARKIGVILLIFVSFYLGAHYWIRWRNTVHDDVTKISRLVECDPNEVKGIVVKQPEKAGGELRFERTDAPKTGLSSSAQLSFSEWKYRSPLKGEADASAMIRLSSMFCELYDPIPTREEEFSQEAQEAESIIFEVKGGKSPGPHTIRFGGMAPDRMNVVKYVSPAGEERVVKIQPKIFQLSSLKPRTYLNMRVMRMTADNVNVATVFAQAKEKFTLEREGSGWRVLVGGKSAGAGSEDASKYVNRLTTLRALDVDEAALSPTACESSKARMRVRLLGVGNREETIFFQYGKEGPVTACNTAREALFKVHRDLIPYLETPAKKLLSN